MSDPQEPKRLPRLIRFEIAPKSIFTIILTGLALWMLGQMAAILVVILCSLILAGTLNPFVGWLEARPLKRVWAVSLVFGVGALLMGLIGLLVFPPLLDQLSHLVGNLPAIQGKLARMLEGHLLTAPIAGIVRNFTATKAATSANANSAIAISLSVIEVVGYAASVVVLAIYFISDFERMRGLLYALTPRRYHLRLARILLNLEPIVGGYMRGQVITSLAISIFTFALLYFCGVPNALPLAAFAGLTDVIPFIGGLLATAPCVVAAFSRGTGIATIVLLAMVGYQEFESRVLVPKVYGRALRLPSAAIIVALLVGGKLGGIVGALLALPLAAAVQMFIEELRLDLPGDDTDNSALKQRDAKAERAYAKQSAGASPEEAGSVAIRIADQVRESDGVDPKKPPKAAR
jgi:predicted PurR-regulated permease PerM